MKNSLLFTIFICITTIVQAQWHEASNVASNSQNVYTLASDGTNIFAGTGSAGISLSTNNGNSWNAVNNGLTNTGFGTIIIDGTNIFAGDSSIFISNNNGAQWTNVSNGLPKTTVNALVKCGSNIFAGTQNNGVYISTNNGTLWTAANNGFTGQISALATCGTTIFAGAPNHGVYVSTNNGGNWTSQNTGLTNTDVHAIAVSGSYIFVGTSSGVFMSTNNGALWTSVSYGLLNTVVNALLINGSDMYAGTNDGMYYSNNNGSSWTANNDGLPSNATIWTFAIYGSNLFAGMHLFPYGVWKRPLSEIKTGFDDIDNTKTFAIYPNPASSIVNFEIQNKSTEECIIQVYTILGIIVKTEVVNHNHIQINIGDLENGIYMVKLTSANGVAKQKLIIQK